MVSAGMPVAWLIWVAVPVCWGFTGGLSVSSNRRAQAVVLPARVPFLPAVISHHVLESSQKQAVSVSAWFSSQPVMPWIVGTGVPCWFPVSLRSWVQAARSTCSTSAFVSSHVRFSGGLLFGNRGGL